MVSVAYGIVWKAIDRRTGEIVAVKKIFDAFRNRTDAQRTFREIMFLQEFGEHPNIIKLLNVIRAQNDRDIYLIFESMETDLHAVIKKGNLLKDIHKCYILYQLLKATKFIHSGNVIHRDQKPSNILLDADCFVKLCDFGLARSLYQIHEDQGSPALTEYVATRWYRAPEILLSSHSYTKGVDMWSIGCILGEMLLGKPLFPGTSTVNQIEQILSVIPAPSQEGETIHSDYRASVINRISSRQRVTIEEILPSSTPAHALDLLKRLLVFNPDKRLTAEEALQHPYVKRFHCPAKEPSLDYSVILPLDDDIQLSVAEYRNKLYEVAPLILLPITLLLQITCHLFHRHSILPISSCPLPWRDTYSSEVLPLPQFENPCQEGEKHTDKTSHDGETLCPMSYIGSQTPPGQLSPMSASDRGFPPSSQGEESCAKKAIKKWSLTSPPWKSIKKWRSLTCQTLSVPTNPRNTQFPSRDAHPFLKSSKKMFQVTANMGAAGYPKASMGSYSQSYGTICKSALQNLPISNSLSGSPGPWPR
uniref:Mitogen-activated protein kinase 15 n=1 Tax=Chelonoidis abingdonii TaxID=106734 RepID=A0A8C0QJW0_CHEAB